MTIDEVATKLNGLDNPEEIIDIVRPEVLARQAITNPSDAEKGELFKLKLCLVFNLQWMEEYDEIVTYLLPQDYDSFAALWKVDKVDISPLFVPERVMQGNMTCNFIYSMSHYHAGKYQEAKDLFEREEADKDADDVNDIFGDGQPSGMKISGEGIYPFLYAKLLIKLTPENDSDIQKYLNRIDEKPGLVLPEKANSTHSMIPTNPPHKWADDYLTCGSYWLEKGDVEKAAKLFACITSEFVDIFPTSLSKAINQLTEKDETRALQLVQTIMEDDKGHNEPSRYDKSYYLHVNEALLSEDSSKFDTFLTTKTVGFFTDINMLVLNHADEGETKKVLKHLLDIHIDKQAEAHPKILFNYRPFNKFTRDAIKNEYLYLSDPNGFNDVTDPFYRLFDSDRQNAYAKALAGIKMACCVEDYKNTLMWSHYAEKHQGLCIEYEIPSVEVLKEKGVLLAKVAYTADPIILRKEQGLYRPPQAGEEKRRWLKDDEWIASLSWNKLDEMPFMEMLYTKHTDWDYEKECRLISYRSEPKLKLKIKAIYFGYNISKKRKNKIKNIAPKGITFYEVKPTKMRVHEMVARRIDR